MSEANDLLEEAKLDRAVDTIKKVADYFVEGGTHKPNISDGKIIYLRGKPVHSLVETAGQSDGSESIESNLNEIVEKLSNAGIIAYFESSESGVMSLKINPSQEGFDRNITTIHSAFKDLEKAQLRVNTVFGQEQQAEQRAI